jgi:hypothetical protein
LSVRQTAFENHSFLDSDTTTVGNTGLDHPTAQHTSVTVSQMHAASSFFWGRLYRDDKSFNDRFGSFEEEKKQASKQSTAEINVNGIMRSYSDFSFSPFA